jgi:hypothetical protein
MSLNFGGRSHVREMTEDQPRHGTKMEKEEEMLRAHPLPDHWEPPEGRKIFRLFFKLICLFSFGYPSLKPVWLAIILKREGDESVWNDALRRVSGQLNCLVIVVRPHFRLRRSPADGHQGELTREHCIGLRHDSTT